MSTASATKAMDGLTLSAAIFAIVVWSSSFAAIAYGLEAFTPAELSLLRFAIASIVLVVPVAAGLVKLPPVRDWPAILALGFSGITLYQLMLGYSLTRIPVGAAAVIIALAPGVTAALAAFRLGERITPSALAGLGVAFAGVILITVGAGREFRFEPMALLALVAVFATSVYFVWQKPLLARTNAIGFTVASIFAGTLGLIPFGLDLPAKIATVPAPQLWSAAYLGIVPTIVGYLCWNFALSRAPASKVSSIMYVQPLVASAIAWIWLGQVPSAL
ncbi:MAG TPA: DMT family transporter, partial [Rhodanobacteraceae bacterium]|nr:DMT family transporter [Rhodanobacteraceae bacterium]